ncbi:hypothetical protein A6R68_09272, partial [Neotoma lepida]
MKTCDAKLTSTIPHVIMEEVFWRTGAEVTTNEVIAKAVAKNRDQAIYESHSESLHMGKRGVVKS